MIIKLRSSKTRGRGDVTETRVSALFGHRSSSKRLDVIYLLSTSLNLLCTLKSSCTHVLCIYRWAHSPPAPYAACTPCDKPRGWCGCTGPRWEGQKGWSSCCRYLCSPQRPATQKHGKWGAEERDASCDDTKTAGATSHLVPPLALQPVGGVRVSIKAARHLEGLDVLSCAHATGALRDDARQTHLLLHVNLLLTTRHLSVPSTALLLQPHGS